MTHTLTNAIYDAKDKTDKNKDEMKKITHKKIPRLNDLAAQFHEDIQDRMFLDIQ